MPPALDVLLAERARLVTAMQKLGEFSDTATELVNTTQDDLVKNLTNLEPTLKALADVGPYLDTVLALVPSFPFPQNFIDRAIRGDYVNIFATIDLTYPAAQTVTVPRHTVGRPERTVWFPHPATRPT